MDPLDAVSDNNTLKALRRTSRRGWWRGGITLVALAALVNSVRFGGIVFGGLAAVAGGLGLAWLFMLVVSQLRWRKIKQEARLGSFSILGNCIRVGEATSHVGSRLTADEHHIIVYVGDSSVVSLNIESPYRILVAHGRPLGSWMLLTDADDNQVGFFLAPTASQLTKQLTQFGWSCTTN